MKDATREVEKLVGRVHKEGTKKLLPEVDAFIEKMKKKHIGVINLDCLVGEYILPCMPIGQTRNLHYNGVESTAYMRKNW